MTEFLTASVHDRARIADLLTSVAAFAGLARGVLAEIASVATEISLEADEAFVRQGDPGDALYVLLAGSADVVLDLETGSRQTLAHLSAGECVGEFALLTKEPRAATVIARTAGRALRVSADALRPILDAHPEARRQLVEFATRRLPSLRLAASGLFIGVDPTALARFDRESNWVRIAGGDVLFGQGDPAEDMYVVVHGSLEVEVDAKSGGTRLVNVVGPGASVGEMALLSGEPRSATVRAIRDSELIRIAKPEFLALLEEYPRAAIELSRTLVKRLRHTTAAPRVHRFAHTLALVPAHATGVTPDFASRLAAALSAMGNTVLRISAATIDAEFGARTSETRFNDVASGRLLSWLNDREERVRYVIYECDATLTPWTDRCLRQADLVLAVANANDNPEPGPIERGLLDSSASAKATRPRYELVLLHPAATTQPRGTMRWLQARARPGGGVPLHHHVRIDRASDVGRLARTIAGASLGLALSGGGARGLAQIGVIKALGELGLEIDSVGGTSMGSFVGGLCALGHDVPTMIEMARTGLGRHAIAGDLGDVTAPVVSLMRGASLVKLCKAMFDDAQIEDLWVPYFAVTTNLTRAQVVVHDQGPLWLWVRASCSAPGLGPPLPYKGDLLVDGGVLNNLPVDLMRARCPGSVIAVDVSAPVDLRTSVDDHAPEISGWPHLARWLNPLANGNRFPNIAQILMRTATLSSAHKQDVLRELPDLYIHPGTDDMPLFAWAAIDQFVDIGYRDSFDLIRDWMGSDARHTATPAAIRRTESWHV